MIRNSIPLGSSYFLRLLFPLFILCAYWGGGPNTMQWDNFEFLIPLIKYTHELWLTGVVPLFSFNVHMGDPLLANGQAGVFYFPYTISLLLSKLGGLGALGFSATILWLHAWLASVGWYFLLRSVRVQSWIALIAVFGIATGGLYQINTSIWIDMVPAFTWAGWMFFGLHLFFQQRNVRIAAIIIAGTIGLMGWAGHPQMAVYFALSVGLFLIFYAWQFRVSWKLLLKACGLMAIGVLLGAPSLFPIVQQFTYSLRTQGWPLEVFFERSTNLDYLISLLNPVTSAQAEFLGFPHLGELLYQGSWVPLGLAGGILFYRQRQASDDLRRLFVTLAFTSVILFWLALGKSGEIYEWTYKIPVWGSFRWPFKIYYYALPCLACAAACGLQIFCDIKKNFFLRSGLIGLLTVISLSFAVFAGDWDYSPLLGPVILLSGLLILPCFSFFQNRVARVCALALAIVSCGGVVALAQGNSPKHYDEDFASIGKSQFKLDRDDRVLPLSHLPGGEPFKMQEYSLLQAAMMNDYESATGCVTALVPSWRMNWLPADVFGVPYSFLIEPLLSSFVADSYNIGYYIVAKKDLEMQNLLRGKSQIVLHSELPSSFIYKNTRVLPQVYWAAKAVALTQRLYNDFIPPLAQQRTAYLEESPGAVEWALAPRDPKFEKSNHSLFVDLENQAAGFLVLSFTWYPSWRAEIDGKETHVFRVNGLISGVEVPAGSKKLVFEFRDASFRWGSLAFGLGLILLLSFLFFSRDKRHGPARAK